ncbi:DUF3352 domain-containing protein [Labilibacter marinus]|uniref:DUF3352 domain-containing protein n=1 Tax=Labilibacter marinus TaxID=1477105 RepID=UPI00082FB121|nr:DUF3352 domain-containing protein [Labilibacter marinus]
MTKRIVSISLVIVLSGLLAFAYFYFNNLKNFKNNDTIKGIPTDASLIIQIQNPDKVIDIILNEIAYSESLKAFNWFRGFSSSLNYIKEDSLIDQSFAKKLLKKSLTISLHPIGKDKSFPLFIYSLNNKAEQNKIIGLFEQNNLGLQFNQRKYNSSTIYSSKLSNGNGDINISIYRGLLLISNSSLLVENSLRQLRADFSLLEDPIFNKLFKTKGNNTDANLLINFENLPKTISALFKNSDKKITNKINRIANWGELDINLKDNHILINGFLYSQDNVGKLNLLFKNINSKKSDIIEVIPDNASFIHSYSFDHSKRLLNNYRVYHNTVNQYGAKNKLIKDLNLKLEGAEIEEGVFNLLDNEFASVVLNSNVKTENKILIIKTKSKSKTLEFLKEIQKTEVKTALNYNIDAETKHIIYKSQASIIFPVLLDTYCPNLPNKYFTFIDNYLIFSNSTNTIKEVIYSNVLNKTLDNNIYQEQFKDLFSYKDNMYIYCDLSKIKNILPKTSNFELLNPNETQEIALSKFYGLGIQLSTANDLLYVNACIQHLPNREKEPETVWQSGLDSTIIAKPTLVKNHNTKEKEIIVQDKSNMLYLISNSGRILWKKLLDGPILSKIEQVDYYRNNKLQYIFNTRNKIYLLDRNGNTVDRYPINLADKATNGISIFDYDNNRNYRIFIACENKNVYAYNIKGRLLTGWKMDKTEGVISKPIQHFRTQGKDYIVLSDDKRNYILNRKGKIRVPIKSNFIANSRSEFSLISENNISILSTTDTKGNIRKINLADGNCEMVTLLNKQVEHYFLSKDITSSKGNENILVTKDKVKVYNAAYKKLFDIDIDGDLALVADTYIFSKNNTKIGVYDTKNSMIYLVNNDGTIYKNFPLRGRSRFSIGFMNKSSTNFNLIVGGENNYLYNYNVE